MEDFLNTQKKLVTNYLNKQAKDNRAIKLANWNPFSDETSKWFETEWMFGVKMDLILELVILRI